MVGAGKRNRTLVHSLAQSLREVRWENLALRMAAVGKSTEDM